MKKIRFGIIGMGNQGTFYAAKLFAAGEIENGELTAVCDLNPKKLEAAREKLGDGIRYFSDYKAMLESGVCDAAIITTPHYSHPAIVTECLSRGIHALSDKPAGAYTKQVREMNEFADTCKAAFGMMFNQRTNCLYRKMREIIAAGGIGRLQRVNWIITDWYRTDTYYNSGEWRATWSGEGGGVLINQCPHQIDLLQWIVGEMPATVRGFCQYGRWHDIEVEDEVTAFFTYKNGATGVLITTTGEAPGTNRLEISGTGGKLLCEGGKLIYTKNDKDSAEWARVSPSGYRKPETVVTEVETDGENPQHKGIINNFANALLGKEKLFVKGTDGYNGVELMNAIELSGWNGGEEISLPIDEERYLAELNKKRAASRRKEAANDGAVVDTSGTF